MKTANCELCKAEEENRFSQGSNIPLNMQIRDFATFDLCALKREKIAQCISNNTKRATDCSDFVSVTRRQTLCRLLQRDTKFPNLCV